MAEGESSANETVVVSTEEDIPSASLSEPIATPHSDGGFCAMEIV